MKPDSVSCDLDSVFMFHARRNTRHSTQKRVIPYILNAKIELLRMIGFGLWIIKNYKNETREFICRDMDELVRLSTTPFSH